MFLSLRVLTPHRRKVPYLTCDVCAQKIARLHHFPSIHNSHELSIPPAPANTRYCAFFGIVVTASPYIQVSLQYFVSRRCLQSSLTSSRRAPKPSPATAGHRQERYQRHKPQSKGRFPLLHQSFRVPWLAVGDPLYHPPLPRRLELSSRAPPEAVIVQKLRHSERHRSTTRKAPLSPSQPSGLLARLGLSLAGDLSRLRWHRRWLLAILGASLVVLSGWRRPGGRSLLGCLSVSVLLLSALSVVDRSHH